MAERLQSNKSSPSSSSSVSVPPMAIEGFDEDLVFSRSEFLSRQEVLKRRSRRLKQLAKVYRDHYWCLMEELKIKYRQYYWEFGKSPFQEDHVDDTENLDGTICSQRDTSVSGGDATNNNTNGNKKLGLGFGSVPNQCVVNGCKVKAMALTKFCHSHILSDAKQKLYKGCTYVTRSSPARPIYCMKPILRSIVPSLCPLHLQKTEMHVTRALKKAGLNVNSTTKLAPKFHIIVAEYVRQIQSARRTAQKEIGDEVEVKEE